MIKLNYRVRVLDLENGDILREYDRMTKKTAKGYVRSYNRPGPNEPAGASETVRAVYKKMPERDSHGGDGSAVAAGAVTELRRKLQEVDDLAHEIETGRAEL